jgi:hypothetical protein
LADFAADIERNRRNNVIVHASERDRQRREREDELEAERRSAPDPRGVLAEALKLRSVAQAEVDRLAPLLVRAGRHVEDLERRQEAHTAAVAADDQAAAEALMLPCRTAPRSRPWSTSSLRQRSPPSCAPHAWPAIS